VCAERVGVCVKGGCGCVNEGGCLVCVGVNEGGVCVCESRVGSAS